MSCIVTLALDEASQSRFNAERERYFPPERNLIPAHLTLFHTVPESDQSVTLLSSAATQQQTFTLHVEQLRSLGKGVAYFLRSPEALVLHRQLSTAFADHLTAQDRQGFRPHVVIQNKVTPQTAQETLAVVQASFTPWTVEAAGLDLWRYLGGPWQHLRRFPFTAEK